MIILFMRKTPPGVFIYIVTFFKTIKMFRKCPRTPYVRLRSFKNKAFLLNIFFRKGSFE